MLTQVQRQRRRRPGAAGAIVALAFLLALLGLAGSLRRAPVAGGMVTIDLGGGSRFVNPLLATSDTDVGLSSVVFAGLTRRAATGNMEPDLASSWHISANGKRYTFELRRGLHWQDGQPLLAADAAYTFHLLANPDYPTYSATWSRIKVTAPNPHTVVFTLPLPDFTFLQQTSVGLLPSHPRDPRWPLGSGPYRLARAAPSRLVALAARWQNDPPPLVPRLAFVLTRAHLGLNRLRCRERFPAVPGPQDTPTTRLLGIGFNLATMPDIAVRRALLGALVAAGYRTGALVPNFLPHLQDTIATPTAAYRSLLQADGWRLRAGHWRRRGVVLAVRLATPKGVALTRYARGIASAWHRAGFVVTMQTLPFAVLLKSVLTPGSFDAALLEWDFGSPDYNPGSLWSSTAALNFFRLDDSVVDRLGASFDAASTFTERSTLRHQVAARLEVEAAGIGLSIPVYACSVPAALHGYRAPVVATSAADLLVSVPHWYLHTDWVLQNPLDRFDHTGL